MGRLKVVRSNLVVRLREADVIRRGSLIHLSSIEVGGFARAVYVTTWDVTIFAIVRLIFRGQGDSSRNRVQPFVGRLGEEDGAGCI